MHASTDVLPTPWRPAGTLGRGLRYALLLVALAGACRAPLARAETFQVACSASALASVIATANTNAEEDFVWLAPSCVYPLAATWVVQPDAGNPLRVHGRAATLSGQDARTPIVVEAGATLHLVDVTVRDGAGNVSGGGGIRNHGSLTLERCTITENAVQGNGAGLYSNGTARVVRSTVSGNTGAVEGGGISNATGGTLTLLDTTVSGNQGLYGGGLNVRGRAALFNSTLFGNGAFIGGGVLNEPAGRTLLSNVTIARNAISGSNGGAGVRNEGTLRIDNSILADHESIYKDCYDSGTITALASSLVEDGSCPFAGAFTGDPKLGNPAGTPQVLAPGEGSAAIDAGQNPTCAGTDQRGARRPHDGNKDGYVICDVGAYEAGACGLLGIEGFALLPLLRRLRRARRSALA
jgi:hypothetical protein